VAGEYSSRYSIIVIHQTSFFGLSVIDTHLSVSYSQTAVPLLCVMWVHCTRSVFLQHEATNCQAMLSCIELSIFCLWGKTINSKCCIRTSSACSSCGVFAFCVSITVCFGLRKEKHANLEIKVRSCNYRFAADAGTVLLFAYHMDIRGHHTNWSGRVLSCCVFGTREETESR
jgi:hypothetical protein